MELKSGGGVCFILLFVVVMWCEDVCVCGARERQSTERTVIDPNEVVQFNIKRDDINCCVRNSHMEIASQR